MRQFVRDHRTGVGIAGVATTLIVAWLAFGVFGVHLLFVDDRVSDERPAGAETEATGAFVSRDHDTSGQASVLVDGSGARILRFEELDTSNGPDLNVFLVPNGADGVGDAIDLGDLAGNLGDQNYSIPASVDLDRYDTVLIWCVRFSSPFGEALLRPVSS